MKCRLGIMIVSVLVASQLPAQAVDYSRLKLVHTLKGHEAGIREIVFSPDGKTLASAAHDGTIRLWDVKSGKAKAVLKGLKGRIRVLRFSPEGAIMASSHGGEKVIRLWDVAAGKQKSTLATTSKVRALAFSPDGKTLAWGGFDGTVRLLDVAAGKETAVLSGKDGWVRDIVFSPNGKTLAVRAYDHKRNNFWGNRYDLRIWSATGKQVSELNGLIATIGFSPGGKTLMAGGFRKVTKLNVVGKKEPTIVKGEGVGKSQRTAWFSARLSPDGKTLATLDKDIGVVNLGGGVAPVGKFRCRLIVMDLTSGRERTIFETRGSKNWFKLIAYSPDGKNVALGTADNVCTLVDAASGEKRVELTAPDDKRRPQITKVAFAPQGKTIAISRGATIKVWVVP